MIRLLIADDEALERETLADIVARRFEHEVTIETCRERPQGSGYGGAVGRRPDPDGH